MGKCQYSISIYKGENEMTKSEFLKLLRQNLSKFSNDEIDDIIDFYDEIIEEKKENGMSEDEAITSLGEVKNIINNVSAELVYKRSEEKNSKQVLRNFFIILGICASPILLPLGFTFLILFLSIFIVLISLIFAFGVAAGAVLLSTIPMAIDLFASGGSLSLIMIQVGICLFIVGLFTLLTISVIKISHTVLNSINKTFSKLIKKKTWRKQHENY